MTEDEAKNKWCPFAQVATAAINNRSGFGARTPGACIATACIAWRYEGATGSRNGFCGLAGVPR